MWPPQLPPWPSRKQLFQRSLARVISLFSFSRKNGRLWVEGGSIGWHELQHWVQNFLDDIWMILAEKNICSILAMRTGTINICSENWEIGQSQVTRKLYCNGFSDTNHVEILERHPSWPTKTPFHQLSTRVFLDASSTPDCFWNFGPDHCGVQHFQPFPTWCQRHEIDDISGRFLEWGPSRKRWRPWMH